MEFDLRNRNDHSCLLAWRFVTIRFRLALSDSNILPRSRRTLKIQRPIMIIPAFKSRSITITLWLAVRGLPLKVRHWSTRLATRVHQKVSGVRLQPYLTVACIHLQLANLSDVLMADYFSSNCFLCSFHIVYLKFDLSIG